MSKNISIVYESTVRCLHCNEERSCSNGCQRFMEVKAKLKLIQQKKKKTKISTIGKALINVYDKNLFPNMVEMLIENGVTEIALEEIKNLEKYNQVAVIEVLRINKKSRNQGAGYLLMHGIQEYLFGVLRLPIAFLIAAPFEDTAEMTVDDYIDYLMSFYQKFGYTAFLENFMLCTQQRYEFLKNK